MSLAGVRSLYICYFGISEPLVQTQVLPYLKELIGAGCKMTLITFEPEEPKREVEQECKDRLAAQGIEWHWLRYHSSFSALSKLYDIRAGARFIRELMAHEKFDVLHARSHVPAAMAIEASKGTAAKVLFDIRGFMPEEYVDAGHWSQRGLLYRLTKMREKSLLQGADAFVVLTEKAQKIISGRISSSKPVAVIPCCVDTQRFAVAYRREGERAALGVRDEKLLVYVGALDGWYLTREMAEFFAEVRSADRGWKLFVATQSEATRFVDVLKERKVPESSYRVQYLPNSEVPNLLSAADAAYCFIKPSYSKQASSPTKIAEYLAAGLPVLCNSGIGDVDGLLERNRVGTTLSEFTPESYRTAFNRLAELSRQPDIANRCRAVAKSELDLKTVGGPAYQSIYLRALGREAKVMYA